MKPRTIVNEDGMIFTLDSSGFYEPWVEPEPEQRTSLRWMLWWAAGVVLIGVGGWWG